MTAIVNELKAVLDSKESSMLNDPKYNEYNEALVEFKDMIARGIVTPRGNQSMSIEEKYKTRFMFNAR
jgi:hypothetical protein